MLLTGLGNDTFNAMQMETLKEYKCVVIHLTRLQKMLEMYAHIGHSEEIVYIDGIIKGKTMAYLFLPCDYGDLFDHCITKKIHLTEPEARDLFISAARAVSHCHDHGVLIREIKTSSFVFTNIDRNTLAIRLLRRAIILQDPNNDICGSARGSPYYVAPEIVNPVTRNSFSGKPADVFSLGVVLYVMLCGKFPFHGNNPRTWEQIVENITKGDYVIPPWVSPSARNLVHSMLCQDPKRRLTVSEALQHPWVLMEELSYMEKRKTRALSQIVPDIN